jgi:hypothetical protein
VILWVVRLWNKNKPEPAFVGFRDFEEKIKELSPVRSTTTSPRSNSLQRQDSKGEILCGQILEEFFGLPFTKQKIFKNPLTGRFLELDRYNNELRLAVEYNGKHHYHDIEQQRRDVIKRMECDKRNIYLIPVPYRIPLREIRQHIASLLPTSLDSHLINQQMLNYVRTVRQDLTNKN